MAISVKHAFSSGKADGSDATLVQPSNWNAEHTITLAADKVLGRAGTSGAVQEITFTTQAQQLADDTSFSAMRTTLGLGAVATLATIATANIDADAVTLAKLVNATAQYKILARKTAAAGDFEECSLSDVLDFVTSAAQGDILYRGASAWERLAAGTSGQYLKTQGAAANPAWVTPATNTLKAHLSFTTNGAGTATIQDSYNIASVAAQTVDSTAGFRVTFTSALASSTYCVIGVATCDTAVGNVTRVVQRASYRAASTFDFLVYDSPTTSTKANLNVDILFHEFA